MKRLFLVFALLFSISAQAQTAVTKIADGRAAMTAHDMPTAKARFAEAVVLDPTNQTAQALLGITRLFDLSSLPDSSTFLNGLGVDTIGRNVYRWDASLVQDAFSDPVLPADYNFTTMATYWQNVMVPESVSARGNLALVTDVNFLLTLTASETKMPVSVNLDYADILMARASLRAAEFLAHLGSGQNLNANLEDIYQVAKGDMLTLQRILNDNPNFLTVGSTSERTAAKTALQDMIVLYRQASTAIRARPAGVNRLFMLDPADLAAEAEFRVMLDRIEQSITAPVDMGGGALYTGPMFESTWNLKALLPAFSASGFDVTTIPDASLGGVVSGMTKEGIAAALSDEHNTLAEMGWEWVSPKPQGNTMGKYLALASGKHLAIGNAGTYLTSTNGTTWTASRIPGVGRLASVVENSGRIVMVTYDGSIYVSDDDAVTWRRVFSDAGSGFHGVTYGGGKYVAVGDYGLIATSADGETWSSFYPNGISMLNVLYTGSIFVAVGVDETNVNAVISTSTDGLIWTQRLNTYLSGGFFWGVAQNGSTLVAVGGNTTASGSNKLANSTDGGLNWTTGSVLASPTGYIGFNNAAYVNGKFVATGTAGTIATSVDGSTWSQVTLSPSEAFLGMVGVGANGTTTYVTTGGGVILVSTDNTTFTRAMTTPPFSTAGAVANPNFLGLKAIDGYLYATGGNNSTTGGVIIRSSDGQSFSQVGSGYQDIWDITKDTVANLLLAGGNNGTVLESSDGGATWSAQSTGFTTPIRSVSFLNSLRIVTGNNGMIRTWDGASWVLRTSVMSGFAIYDVAWGNGVYVAVGGNNNGISLVLTSPDGEAWTQQNAYTGNTFRGIVFADGQFTAVGFNGQISRSEDGINWQSVGTGDIRTNILGINYIDGRYYATLNTANSTNTFFESQSAVLISSDGEEWVRVTQGTNLTNYRTELFLGRIYSSHNGAGLMRTQTLSALTGPTASIITSGTAASNLAQGSSLALVAAATSDGSTTYQWYKEGNPLLDATGPGLTLNNVQAGDAGSYTVVVTNAAGTDTSDPIVVSVNATTVAPQILFHPQSQTLNVGFSTSLSVEASGTAPLTYQWKKDGVVLSNGGNVSGVDTTELMINNLTAANGGTYTVEVSNGIGDPAVSLPAVLTVDSNPAYTFTNMAGSPGFIGSTDGTGWGARFNNPHGVAVDGAGNVYVVSPSAHTIRKVTSGNVVTTIAGDATQAPGYFDAIGAAARFNGPRGLALNAAGTMLYVADTNNGKIRKVDLSTNTVTTWATGLNSPLSLVLDASGNAYVTCWDHTIRKITPDGLTIETLAGAQYSPGSTNNATGTSARFNNPMAIAIDASGTTLYVADAGNALIRKVVIAGLSAVTTYAGTANLFGFNDGPALSGATFSNPMGITVDPAGSVIVTDNSAGTIRKISTNGVVTTIGGQAYSSGFMDGIGTNARFNAPAGLASDPAGNLYLAENNNHIVRRASVSASLTIPVIQFSPMSQTVSIGDTVTFNVTASGISALSYQWRKNGQVIDGATSASLTLSNVDLTAAGGYRVLVTSSEGSALSDEAVLTVTVPPSITGQPVASNVVNTGSPLSLSVTASEAGATYQWRRNGFEVPGQIDSTLNIASATRADAGYYDVVINGLNGAVVSTATDVRVAPTAYPGDLAFDPSFSVSPLLTLSTRIYAVLPLAGGKWLVGGEFVNWNGTPRAYLARLNSDYSLDTGYTPPPVNGSVYALAAANDGTIYVGGEFTSVDGHVVPGLFRLNPAGVLDLAWRAQDNPPKASVTALAVEVDGQILVARSGTLPDQPAMTGTSVLRRLNADGTLDNAFSTDIGLAVGVTGSVRLNVVVPEADGDIAFGGSFSTVNTTTRANLARVNAAGTLDAQFAVGPVSGANNTVWSLTLLGDGRYLVGGNFGQVAGTGRNRAAIINADGTLGSFTPLTSGGINGNVLGAAMQTDGKIVLAGTFTLTNGQTTDGLVRLTAAGAVDTLYPSGNIASSSSFSTVANPRTIFVYPQVDGSIALFGGFQAAFSQPRIGLAVVAANGTLAVSPSVQLFRPAYANSAFLNAVGQLSVFGSIDVAGATGPLGQAVRLNDNGSLDNLNFPQGTGYELNGLSRFGIYRAMRQGDGKIIAIGDLAGYNGHNRFRLVRINADGSFDDSFNAGSGPSSILTQLLPLSGGSTLLYGMPAGATYNGMPVGRVVRINPDGALDTSFNIGGGFLNATPASAVPNAAFEQVDGKLVLAGPFATYNGNPANGLVRLNSDGSYDNTFNSGSGPVATSGQAVIAIASLPNGQYVIGGNFTTYDGLPVNRMAVLNADGTRDNSFAPPDGTVLNGAVSQIIAQEDGKFLVIGDFTGTANPYAVRLTATGAVDPSFQLRGITSQGFGTTRVVTGDDGSVYAYGGVPISYNNGVPLAVTRFRGAASVPTVAAEPAAVAAAAGGSATFAVRASGTGPFTYQWRHNGGNIDGATYSALNLSGLSAANLGNYDVVITGPGGSVTSSAAALTLSSSITFSAQPPAALSMASGWNTITLSVTASSTAGGLTYQWQRNATNLTNGTVNTTILGGRLISTIIGGATTATLTLSNALTADAGEYRCVITDSVSTTATSNATTLTVTDVAPVVTGQTQSNLVLTSGSRARIFANISGSRPLTIQWKRNGVDIPGFNGSSFTAFDLDKISAAQAGTYTVDISNAYGTASFTPVVLSLAGTPDPKDTWQWVMPEPQGNNLVGVTSGNGLLVAVGRGGTVISTTDGQTGNIGTSGNGNSLGEVAYDAYSSKFYAAGSFSTVMTSPDALTWTNVSLTGVDDGYTGIATNGTGTVLLVGGDYNFRPTRGLVRISSNGGAWTLPANVPAAWDNLTQFTSAAFGDPGSGGRFVIVGVGGSAYYSADSGANWTSISTGTSQAFQRIAYDNGRFVAVGDAGTIRVSSDGQTFVTPTWNGAAPTTTQHFYGITYLSPSNQWLAVGTAGLVATSTDNGLTWTASVLPNVSTDLYSVGANANLVLAAGRFGRIFGATNNAGFTPAGLAALGASLQSNFFNDNNNNAINYVDWDATSSQFVAVATNGNIHTAGADGINWTRRSQPAATSNFLTSWTRLGAKILVTGSGGTIYSSADNAATWSATTGLGGVQFWSVTTGSSQAVAVGSGGAIYTTADGAAWSPATSGVSAVLKRIAYANGRYVAVGGNDDGGSITILTSDDGTTWTARTPGTTGQLWGVDYNSANNVWIAVGSANSNGNGAFALRSTDNGVTWSRVELSGLNFVFNVRYAGGQWLAVGSPHVLAVSSDDGLTWSYKSMPAMPNINTMRSVAKGPDTYVVVGNDSIIQVSAPLAPRIDAQPASATVNAGTTATLTITATSAYALSYQWRQGGIDLSGATGASYQISNFQSPNAGNYDVVVTATRDFDGVLSSVSTVSTVATLTLGTPATSFSSWQNSVFTEAELLDGAKTGPNTVFGQDGLPNLVKYALGLDPKVNATAGLPEVSTDATYWLFTYTRPADRPDIGYVVQYSTNLTSWTEIPVGTEHAVIASGGGNETWRARYALTSAANLYFRLKITQ